MKKLVLLSTLAAFSFAGVASAATLTNLDKADAKIQANIGGKVETVTLKENASYDSKGKDVGFTVGSEKPVLAKGEEHFAIKGGKVEALPAKEAAKTDVKTDVKAETKTEAKVAPVTLSPAPAKATN